MGRHPGQPLSPRSYPRLRALVRAQLPAPGSIDAQGREAVPGTFFPRKSRPTGRRKPPVDLDEMLREMATGLLIGADSAGDTEVRVALNDDFFAGTELIIKMTAQGLIATLVPPDHAIFRTLNADVGALRDRLEARGLRVLEVTVQEP